MNISLRWIRDMVAGLEGDAEAIAARLALRGAPVDGIEAPGEGLADIVVGRVVTAEPHPNADRLRLCTVDGGDGLKQVVCGAPNVTAGAFYPFAPIGSVLPGDFTIKKAKIRGEVSEGMLCSAKELGLGVDHEGIMTLPGEYAPGSSFIEAMGLDDVTLDVEVTANRGDLLSHVGVARELATAGSEPVLPDVPDAPTIAPEYVSDAAEVSRNGITIRIEAPELCARYMGAVLRGVQIGSSPAWLQERLRGAGARPINNVVDATNYVMLELGQPLHAFNLSRLADQSIVVRQPRGSELIEPFMTLDGEERTLSADMLMICDADRPVAVGGVMGGENSQVDDTTRDILLECAWFDPRSIRKTRNALGISTDASYRFERGVDREQQRRALERAISVILATAGGALDGPVLDVDTNPWEATHLRLRLARIEAVLGVPFRATRVRELLSPLGFEVGDEDDGALDVRVPGFRDHDVTREIDLIEEVARSHGYDAFPDELGPYRPGSVPDNPLFQLEDELRDHLSARGLFETQTPAFVPPGEGDVEVANPLNSREPWLRRRLLPSLLRRLQRNLAHGNRDVRLFELGTSFARQGPGEAPRERAHLAAVLTGRRSPPHWSEPEQPLDVWDLKALATAVAEVAYRGAAAVRPAHEAGATFVQGFSFEILDGDGGVVGSAGRIPDARLDIPVWAGDVWGLEVALPDPVPTPREVVDVPLPQHPGSDRDLALVVGRGVAVGDVVRAVEDAGGTLLRQVTVFDVYQGEGLESGARSVALRLRFQAPDRTLKDKEVDRGVASVLKQLEEELGVRQRG